MRTDDRNLMRTLYLSLVTFLDWITVPVFVFVLECLQGENTGFGYLISPRRDSEIKKVGRLSSSTWNQKVKRKGGTNRDGVTFVREALLPLDFLVGRIR
jgi:hypothetical protein